jgi:hypothetical protein
MMPMIIEQSAVRIVRTDFSECECIITCRRKRDGKGECLECLSCGQDRGFKDDCACVVVDLKGKPIRTRDGVLGPQGGFKYKISGLARSDADRLLHHRGLVRAAVQFCIAVVGSITLIGISEYVVSRSVADQPKLASPGFWSNDPFTMTFVGID